MADVNLNGPGALRGAALVSVIGNVGIVITGGAVRLTGSGLGCPTWPKCTDDSYAATPEMGIYGAIEFSNRMLTFVVGIVAVAGLVIALYQRPRAKRPIRLAAAVLLGIPAQAVIGGITVLTDLNPWVVGCHFLVSMAVIAAAYAFWAGTHPPDRAAPQPQPQPEPLALPRPLGALALVVVAATAAVLVVGTLVTGSGPHAGDVDAKRNGLNPEAIAQIHADLVFLLIGLAIATWFALRAAAALAGATASASASATAGATASASASATAGASAGASAAAKRAAWLIGIIAAQGLIGFVQYFTNVPAILVGIHMAGACAVWLASLALLNATRPNARPNARPASHLSAGHQVEMADALLHR